jgi:FkbM family methyltransferase|tara:strand:- start:189 stop:803 length:615 start_codon:yes stop_codon:yes gene_type:complete
LKNFGLVVIGAHIGVHILSDLDEYKSQNVLLVEPVPHNLRLLRKNVQNYKSITIEPATVGLESSMRKFYFVKEDSVSKLGKHWASGIGSFDKQHIINHKTKRFNIREEDIETVDIKCLTFNEIVEKYSISHIDKLQIDVEGAEFEILDSIDYNKIKINKILFESKHFDGTFKEGKKLELIKKKLVKNNYNLKKIDSENILALKK